jgi:hypothetical protein
LDAARRVDASERRRRLTLVGGAVLGVIALVVVIVVIVSGSGSSSGSGAGPGGSQDATARAPEKNVATPGLPGAQTTPPPWTNGTATELEQRLRALSLPLLTAEGTVLHIHQHLDVFVGGKPTPVPADIGIDPGGRFLSPLHTHDNAGVLHVESPTKETFTLGQFFGVWGVPLTSTQLGGLKTGSGELLCAYVNGKPFSGDPGAIELASHQELVVAYGTKAQLPNPVPDSYDFPAGL